MLLHCEKVFEFKIRRLIMSESPKFTTAVLTTAILAVFVINDFVNGSS